MFEFIIKGREFLSNQKLTMQNPGLIERNPDVFYELAIRHAIRKPLVQIIKKCEQIPFDAAGARTIHDAFFSQKNRYSA